MRHAFSLRTLSAATCAGSLAATAIGIHTAAASGAAGGSMGPASTMPLATWTGWYDGHKVLFISTDTSSKTAAKHDGINYSADLAKALPSTVHIYLVTNGAFANRGAVFGSQPGESDYTPLWQEVSVTWKTPAKAVALTSDNQILSLQKAGTLTLRFTGLVLNCPILKVLRSS